MLKQRVIIKSTDHDFYGMEGIIVAVNAILDEESRNYDKSSMVYKVLVGDTISDWLPHCSLEILNQAYAQTA